MAIFHVRLVEEYRPTPDCIFINFECGYAQLAELTEALREAPVHGHQLFTIRDSSGVRQIIRRNEIAIGAHAVASASPSWCRFSESDEDRPRGGRIAAGRAQ